MHFGQESGILTNLKPDGTEPEPLSPSPALKALCNGLKALISKNAPDAEKPVLILNGDTLELALTTMNQAAMVFERFIELTMLDDGTNLFEKIIYIPGNHDHHLWELARETHYVNYLRNPSTKELINEPHHVTPMFLKGESLTSFFLSNLVKRTGKLQDFEINIAYPNLGLIDSNKKRCAIITHGHFIEWIYLLMTETINLLFPDRKQPINIWDLEKENFAWIDFFWSTMGRSGDAGSKTGEIYESLNNEKALKKLIGNLAESLAKKFDLPGIGDWSEAKILEVIFNFAAKKITSSEKKHADGYISDDAKKGLEKYLEGPVLKQYMTEVKKIEPKGTMPDEMMLVFGHTHKPFEKNCDYTGYPGAVRVYNTGGWVVEDVNPVQPNLGAAALLFDEEINPVALQFYMESNYQVRLLDPLGGVDTPFFNHVKGAINDTQDVWTNFITITKEAVKKRKTFLQNKLDKINAD
jgi:UDP-2,3-diacylglucosamine pyrophosphatase LpxH